MSHLPIVPAQCFAVAVRTGEPSSKEAMKKTLTEAELRQLVSEGKTHHEIAFMTGRHASHISAACSLLGIFNSKPSRNDRAAGYFDDVKAGMSLQEVAAKHGLTYAAVRQSLKASGFPTSAKEIWRAQLPKAA